MKGYIEKKGRIRWRRILKKKRKILMEEYLEKKRRKIGKREKIKFQIENRREKQEQVGEKVEGESEKK